MSPRNARKICVTNDCSTVCNDDIIGNDEFEKKWEKIKDDNDNDSCSVDTDDAFYEMLGLPRDDGNLMTSFSVCSNDDDDDEQEDDDDEFWPTSFDASKEKGMTIESIPLPNRCSRYLYPPDECTAFTVSNFLTPSQCQFLIQKAASTTAPTPQKEGGEGGFQYITEATHTAPGGTSYTVQIQNPNPHKLSVFEHSPTTTYMWKKLQPIIQPYIRQKHQQFSQRRTNNRGRYCCDIDIDKPLGLNPRIRVLKYDSSDEDFFQPHFDATTTTTTTVDSCHKSFLTVLVYLNTGNGVDFGGGETLYLDSVFGTGATKASAPRRANTNGNGECESDTVGVIPTAGKVVIFEHDLYHSGEPLLWGTKYVMRTDIMFSVRKELEEEEEEEEDWNHEKKKREEINDGHVQNPRIATSCPTDPDDEVKTKNDSIHSILELCNELDLLQHEKDILDDLGMLHITIESFLTPGISALKIILQDVLQNARTVDRLVYAAVDIFNRNKN